MDAPETDTRFTTLIVSPRPWEIDVLESVIRSLGVHAIGVRDFASGKQLLGMGPDLLITQIQLGEYNGLQLVLNATMAGLGLTAIVMSRWDDPVLLREAEALGATFVPWPIEREELIAAILRTVANQRRSRAERIRPPFERRRTRRRKGGGRVVVERRVAERRRDVAAVFTDAGV
jgi:DNA-binding NtrC family response regulator